ncbi:hypothetical protein MMC30_007308 [Trapelia coarctata]|nr:hypothetical protein [Trapelia coarctata]
MSVPNGRSSSSTASGNEITSQAGEKRKRSPDVEVVAEQKPRDITGDGQEAETNRRFDELLTDLLEVLRAHDTTPSILEHPFISNVDERRSTKRVKLSTPLPTTSIASQIESNAYHNIEEVIADVDTASSSFKSGNPSPGESNKNQPHPLQIAAFKQELGSIIRRAMTQNPESVVRSSPSPDSTIKVLGGSTENKKTHVLPHTESAGRLVLTLYGSVPTPKQLFSSLQQPVDLPTSGASQASEQDQSANSTVFRLATDQVIPPLRESALPNGISTSRIIPVHSETLSTEEKRATFGDTFGPPPGANIPPLKPPSQTRHTATRSQSVNWYNPAEVTYSRTREPRTYATQPLSTGQWLLYNVVPSPAQLSSPGEKRRQRDRALSTGESKASLPDEVIAAHEKAKEDALFKSAYSSFAPDRDDSAALVPQQVKSRLWWERIGERRYWRMRASAGALASENDVEALDGIDATHGDDEEQLFKEAVEAWEPEEVPPELDVSKKETAEEGPTEKDTQDILDEISELLETLSSYQRIRNLSLATNARTTAGQNPQLTAMSGSPTTPSPAEFDLYEILKSQLVVMVSALPPYAVAKLNGDQLGALNVSTIIHVQGKNVKGTMEEHEVATKAMQPVLNAATGPAVRTATPQMPPVAGRVPHYQTSSTPVQRTAYAPPRVAAPSATYPSHQYSARPASSNQYGSYSAQQPPLTSRHSYSAHQYGPQTPQAPGSQYTNGHRPYPTQSGYSMYGQQYATTPSTPHTPMPGNQLQRPSQPGYQQRAQNSQSYGYGSASTARSASPQNPASYLPQQQARSQYHTPNAGQVQSRPQVYYPPSAQISSVNANAALMNGAATTIGQHMNLTAEEQATLMARQKELIAANQHQSNGTIRMSGTSQPVNGVGGTHGNGTVTPQPNGIVAGSGL